MSNALIIISYDNNGLNLNTLLSFDAACNTTGLLDVNIQAISDLRR